MTNGRLWQYDVIGAFNEEHYKGMLTAKDIQGTEKAIKEVTEFITEGDSTFEQARELNGFYYVLAKNGERYLLESKNIKLLPIIVKKSVKVGHNREGFNFVTEFNPVGFRPERKLGFKQVIDGFADFAHGNEKQFKLWKIIAFTSYLSRINVRVCSNPSFGKDSILSLINDLVGGIGAVTRPTIAKLEYLTHNKVLLVNEFMNLGAQETRDIEQYLLTVGDFKNKYQKRTRAHASFGGSEEYDISKFSVLLAFNRLEDYPDGDKSYFDKVHTNQLKERFLPLKFDGLLKHEFMPLSNPKTIAMENKQLFIDMAKSITFYKNEENVNSELKKYGTFNFEFRDRWKINFNTICRFINLYSTNELEYKELVFELYKCHTEYLAMVNKGNGTLNQRFVSTATDEDYTPIETVEEFIGED